MKKLIIIFLLLFLIPSATATSLTDFALEQLDKPYCYATAGPDSFDCSGFVCYCISQIYNINLPHSAYEIGYDDTYEKIEDVALLQEGDVLFFNTVADNDLCDHAAIYLGNNEIIHCSSSKKEVVISQLTDSYYERTFSWARRIVVFSSILQYNYIINGGFLQ